MKSGVIVANSKKCTYFVLMLLLVSMLTKSIGTTYIMCIRWKVSPTYTKGLFEKFHSEAYWSLCQESRICPGPKKKRNSKGHLVSFCIYTKKNIWESGQPKQCSMCRISDHSKNKCPTVQTQTNNIKFMLYSLYFKKYCCTISNLNMLFYCL